MNILGIVRNGGEALRATLERIELLRTQLADSRVIIATNDNSDDTGLILEGYSAGAKAVEVLSMDGLATSHPDRVDRICHARNEVLRHLFSSTDVFPTTLVLDLDGPNEKLDTHEVLGAMSRNDPHWDAVFGNPQPPTMTCTPCVVLVGATRMSGSAFTRRKSLFSSGNAGDGI